MACDKHGPLSGPAELCPVCLLEQALEPASVRDLIIQVPLGQGAETSVFLVRQEAPAAALLRLKVWRRRAPASFLENMVELASRLTAAAEPAIVAPLAACLDADGCPAVLSGFRQGLPILHCVESGALSSAAALALLESLAPIIDRCRRAGLTHGSLVSGNVLVEPGGSAAFLVDFGLAALFRGISHAEAAAADRAGLAALATALTPSGSRQLPRGNVDVRSSSMNGPAVHD